MRVSVQLEHINTLTVEELFRVISAIDSELARCNISVKSVPSTQYRHVRGKITKLQHAKALFLIELTTRQQTTC